MAIRHKTVAVGVLYDDALGFLLFFNQRWGQYAFAMKKPLADQDLADVALAAFDEDSPLKFPDASASPAATVGAFGPSGGVGEDTYYDYHVFELDPGQRRGGPATDPNARFFRYPDLIESAEVTWATKEIARALVEGQEACLAVITRISSKGRQFLLVHNPGYGWFFPAARRKTNDPPEVMAAKAVEWDAGYHGELDAQWCGEVPDVHMSHRYGPRRRKYLFHVCRVRVPRVDLTPGQSNGKRQADNSVRAAIGTGSRKTNCGIIPRSRRRWARSCRWSFSVRRKGKQHGSSLRASLLSESRSGLACLDIGHRSTEEPPGANLRLPQSPNPGTMARAAS